MNDTISRQDAIKAICEDGTWLESQGCTEITMAERKQRDADILIDLPSIQPEQKRGKWIESTELSEQVKGKKFCSNCGKAQECMEITDKAITIKSNTSKFCPNCGARMKE